MDNSILEHILNSSGFAHSWHEALFVMMTLVAALHVKHFIADYPLQSFWIIKNKNGTQGVRNQIMALSIHSAIHGALTFFTLLMFLVIFGSMYTWNLVEGTHLFDVMPPGSPMLMLTVLIAFAIVDAGIHWIIDFVKADTKLGGRYPYPFKPFWIALGLDQAAHHLTSLGIAYWFTLILISLLPMG